MIGYFTVAILISGGDAGNKSLSVVLPSEIHSASNNSVLTDHQRIKLKEIRKLARLAGHEHPEVITEVDGKTCYKEDCLDAAKEFYSAMDFSQEPCENWKKFACEWRTLSSSTSLDQLTFLSKTVEKQVKEILFDYEIDNELILNAQEYYGLCIDWFQGFNQWESLTKYLKKLGNWPLLTGETNIGPDDWIKILIEILKLIPDDANSLLLNFDVLLLNDKMVLKLEPGATGMSFDYDDIDLLLQFLTKKSAKETFRQEMWKRIQDVMKSLAEAKFNMDSGDLIEINMIQEKLKSEAPDLTIDLNDVLHKVFEGTDLKIPPDMQVYSNWKGLSKYLKSVQSLEQVALVNLLFLQLTTILIGDSTSYFEELNIMGMKNYQRHLSRFPSRQCYSETVEVFSYALSEEYIYRNVKDQILSYAKEMVNCLKHGFQSTIDSIKWLETQSKDFLKDKIANMNVLIGYPEWIRNRTILDSYYKEKSPNGVKTYLDYRLSILSWLNGKFWNMKLKSVQPNVWNFNDKFGFVGDTNVKYIPSLNQLRVPAGTIQAPLFNIDYPGYMNFGGLGSVIAREMAHAFDLNGIYINNEGDYGMWLDDKTYKSYKEWTTRVQRDWDDDDLSINEKIVNILSFHIVTKGYEEFLRKSKKEKDVPVDIQLPGLSSLSPEKLLNIKLTNMLCENPVFKELRLEGHLLKSKSGGLYPLTRTKSFSRLFGCASDTLIMAFDFL